MKRVLFGFNWYFVVRELEIAHDCLCNTTLYRKRKDIRVPKSYKVRELLGALESVKEYRHFYPLSASENRNYIPPCVTLGSPVSSYQCHGIVSC